MSASVYRGRRRLAFHNLFVFYKGSSSPPSWRPLESDQGIGRPTGFCCAQRTQSTATGRGLDWRHKTTTTGKQRYGNSLYNQLGTSAGERSFRIQSRQTKIKESASRILSKSGTIERLQGMLLCCYVGHDAKKRHWLSFMCFVPLDLELDGVPKGMSCRLRLAPINDGIFIIYYRH